MKTILIFLLVFLVGCASNDTITTTNKHQFIENQNFSISKGQDTRTIMWVRLSDEELQTKCSNITMIKLSVNSSFVGCATNLVSRPGCVVYTSTNTTHQILGHEVRHCFQGEFHK